MFCVYCPNLGYFIHHFETVKYDDVKRNVGSKTNFEIYSNLPINNCSAGKVAQWLGFGLRGSGPHLVSGRNFSHFVE